ncbi:MAG: nucleoside monophosphate kinase [Candidatus Campbellbacteria bacterium]|nr:nucleoside monophosphate kinase [Candidatus Campbellbacteria bacterium]
MNQHTIIFIGSQGSGKGTQAQRLTEYLEVEYPEVPVFLFGTGEGFRNFAKEEGYTNKIVADYLSRGEILPVFLPIWLWTKMCIENLKGNEHIVFEGSPRTKLEAQVMESAFDFYARDSVTVIKLEVSKEEVVRRLLERGRSDDTREAIEERLSWYEENVNPALEFFAENSRYDLVSIDGEKTPDEVFESILEKTNLS